ncbi:dimethylarginine dimethylaminohydrolase family protein [Metamycoplasma neophronis]|uniref:N(G),N(G)-dimethylarginine dimethylaminohydrolase n=1 Tax=Metamycoplasma neophronis TaxID=872983 RepID=A0ABY2Z3V2_9BACT|nr:arginine deiminase family protein [Metamycoplasma neophronis]TPR53710.1 N(G),N(G)-dimethylarginine dimethylaminohydrolase [Metamycoplasma neophronis]
MKKPIYKTFIVKRPCHALIDGITGSPELGKPDYENAVKQHDEYIKAIKSLGIEVEVLPSDERYPDSCFVEDPVIIIPGELAIITNPGAESRNGEKAEMLPTIQKFFPEEKIKYIKAPGYMDGGDVMPVGDTYYIGLSDRTNAEAIKQFEEFVKPLGKKVIAIPVTQFLHLKTGTTYIENGNLLVTGEFEQTPEFQQFNLIRVPKEEEYGVNVIYCNDNIIMPAGYPTVKKALESLPGYKKILEVDSSEYKKIDGGLTCLSVRF